MFYTKYGDYIIDKDNYVYDAKTMVKYESLELVGYLTFYKKELEVYKLALKKLCTCGVGFLEQHYNDLLEQARREIENEK